jgi:nicotinamidase/pyrazinamidase
MKALICVDIQNDFCPGGSLAVPEGDKIVSVINDLLSKFDLVIFTKDWHHPKMDAFASQHIGKKPFDKYINPEGLEDTLWPNHCVQDTFGAEFHKDIDFGKIKGEFYIFKKGMKKKYHPYSGFGGTDLAKFLKKKKVTNLFIGGLALDYCVKDTAIDASKEGFEVVVIEDACAPIDSDINSVIKAFKDAEVAFIESWELEEYENPKQ